MFSLILTKKSDCRLKYCAEHHYSKPLGFVGRSLCYAIMWNNDYWGHIIGGSTPKYLPNRNRIFDMENFELNCIINNIFFHVEKKEDKYPCRNFTTKIISTWREQVKEDWEEKYKDIIIGYESLVELPRTGECYRRDAWELIGQTKGYTCKRTGGKGTDSWSGKRVWDTQNLRPKLVFARKV